MERFTARCSLPAKLVLVLAPLLLLAAIPLVGLPHPTLHGEWTSEFFLVGAAQGAFPAGSESEHTLSLLAEAGRLETGLALAWDQEGLSDWDLEVRWESDPFELLAEVRFDGATAAWDKTRLGMDYQPDEIPLELAWTWDLVDDRDKLRIQAEVDPDPLSLELDVRCAESHGEGLRFDRCDAEIDLPLPGGTELSSETRFSDELGWSYTDVEFDLPECRLPTWLAIELTARIDRTETTVTLDPDVSLADIVLNSDPGTDSGPIPSLVVELPFEVKLDDRCRFDRVCIAGVLLSCEFDASRMEAAVSFDPEWNRKLAGDKGFDCRFELGWEETFVGPNSSMGSFEAEAYVARPSHADDVPERRSGEVGICGCLAATASTGAERSLSWRLTAPISAPQVNAGDPRISLECELGLELAWSW